MDPIGQPVDRTDYRNKISQLLKKAKIPDQFNFVEPYDIVYFVLLELDRAKMLTQDNINSIIRRNDLERVYAVFSELNEAGVLTKNQDVFDSVMRQDDLEYVPEVLLELNRAKMLTQDNINSIMRQDGDDLEYIYVILRRLDHAKILTQDNFNALIRLCRDYGDLTISLTTLADARLLTQDNFNDIIGVNKLVRAALLCERARILNQGNLNSLLQSNSLLSRQFHDHGWDRIPYHVLNQAVFDRLVTIDRNPNEAERLRQLYEYVDQLIGINPRLNNDDDVIIIDPQLNNNAGINYNQSIHAASVEKSKSVSAKALFKRYGGRLNPNIIRNIQTYINGLQDNGSKETRAAKRCIARMIGENGDFNIPFKDTVSGVSLEQLLALVWLGANDEGAIKEMLIRNGAIKKEDIETERGKKIIRDAVENALKMFIDGLYEIQRGYNISPEGVDNGQPDRPICTGGTFNKLIEKLQGIHPDAQLTFVTQATAALKLPIVVREEAIKYLREHPEADDLQGTPDVASIWGKIKGEVANRMFDEFGSLYEENRENQNFIDLAESGESVQLTNKDIPQFILPRIVREEAGNYLREHKELIDAVEKDGIKIIWDKIKDKIASRLKEFEGIFDSAQQSSEPQSSQTEFDKFIDSGKDIILGKDRISNLRKLHESHGKGSVGMMLGRLGDGLLQVFRRDNKRKREDFIEEDRSGTTYKR